MQGPLQPSFYSSHSRSALSWLFNQPYMGFSHTAHCLATSLGGSTSPTLSYRQPRTWGPIGSHLNRDLFLQLSWFIHSWSTQLSLPSRWQKSPQTYDPTWALQWGSHQASYVSLDSSLEIIWAWWLVLVISALRGGWGKRTALSLRLILLQN